jgi:prephenate dehydrogenase
MENRQPLLKELEILINNITQITDAIKDSDQQRLQELLEQAHKTKEALGE